MKKLKLFTIVWVLLIAMSASGQPELTFKLDKPRIVVNEDPFPGDYFEFDVLVKANAVGSRLYAGQIAFNFNGGSLYNTTAGWVLEKGVLLSGNNSTGSPKYSFLPASINGGVFQLGFTAPIESSGRDVPTDWNTIGTDYQTLITLRIHRDGDINGVAGVSFVEDQMNGQFSYHTGENSVAGYFNPNIYEPANFTTTYLGRIFEGITWTQSGGTVVPLTPVNTSVWSSDAGATNELAANNVRIHSGATLTIGINGQATASSIIIEDEDALIINSDATNTGSLIVGSVSGAGSAVARRYMTTGAWHFVSSPVSGQSIAGFLADNNLKIPIKEGKRGMMDYNPAGNVWNDFFTDATEGNLLPGSGYAVRIDPEYGPGTDVEFSGNFTTGPVTLNSLVANSWNLVGNPYTSGLGVNDASTATNFLLTNIENLDPSYAAIYLWDKLDANNELPGKYSFISNADVELIPGADRLTQGYVQPGQGFLVKMNAATSLSYTTTMQFHINNDDAPFKSAKSWPAIALDVSSGQHSSSAYIAFNNRMTPGLDPTYDVGAYRGDADLMVFSKLIEDNGVNFVLQCLPENHPEDWMIPVGILSRSGGEVTFTTKTLGLPKGSKVTLEDRQTNIFTPLISEGSFYRTMLAANTNSTGRFFLHVSNQTTNIANDLTTQELKAYMVRDGIVIDGRVSSKAVATLYDLQGRSIIVRNLGEGIRNTISAQGLVTGIYLLQVTDNNQQFKTKIPVVGY